MLVDKAQQQGSEAKTEEMPQKREGDGSAGASKAAGKVQSVIGAGVTVQGNLVSKGELEIEGEVQGDVRCKSVQIGDKAKVIGEVSAQDVVVLGRVEGAIRGEFVMLKSGSRVEADLYYTSLVVHQGAIFDGASQHSSDPLSESGRTKGGEKPEPRVMGYQEGENRPA